MNTNYKHKEHKGSTKKHKKEDEDFRMSFPKFPLNFLVFLCAAFVFFVFNVSVSADPLFDKARPVLAEKCFSCHSHAANKSKGGLVLDSREAMLHGGDSGPAVVPGEPEKSLLIKAVNYADENLQMPPKGKLSDTEIAALTDWIKGGATWPGAEKGGVEGITKRGRGKISEEDKAWWAFQPVKNTAPPPVADGKNAIDKFILARLEKEGLQSAPEAAKTALIRRVTFDLTGLPPTPDEVNNFVADSALDAYEKLVDRLLASPRYGERMARGWLDLVRYADSDGYRIDDYRPDAWRYRDYVIRAFNADKPYDRFVQEQLAGDEMFPGDPDALLATGYLRHWIYEYNSRDARGQWDVILNDLTDTTGDVFLGMGVQCARCHDHKFDPILQKDYYRLQAFFAPLLPRQDLIAATQTEKAEYARNLAVWEGKTADIRAQIDAIEKDYREKAQKEAVGRFPDEIQAMVNTPKDKRTPFEGQISALVWRQVEYEYGRLDNRIKSEDKEKLIALRKQLAAFDSEKPASLPVAFAVSDIGPQAPPTFIPKKAKEAIEPGILSVLDEAPAKIDGLPGSTGRRSALAFWLTRPDNPLTVRVIVNRVWQQHFGRGLAANASDFGKLGQQPTHPELLDYLAKHFVEGGWSLKKLHRLIVTSATYRQSSQHPDAEKGRLKDPENLLLWRARPHRLEAEQIRDAVFAVTGELNEKIGGTGVNYGEARRSIYTRIMRNSRDPFTDVFDAPLWFASASSRPTTTTPVQSLLLVNSPFMLQRGRALAGRLEKLAPNDETKQIETAYRLVFGRAPSDNEAKAASAFLTQQAGTVDSKVAGSDQASFLPEKVPYRDGQGALIEPAGKQQVFRAKNSKDISLADGFTIEAYVVPRTVAETGAVRNIAAKWNGDLTMPGWTFGITGQGSRRKPMVLVLQTSGKKRDGTSGEVVMFSDLNVTMNKPYFMSASVTYATKEQPGKTLFTLKDLSNDDEPLLMSTVAHDLVGGLKNDFPITLGGRSGAPNSFHGALDDVRLSKGALDVAQLLYQSEGVAASTLGYWRFEQKPDVLADTSGHHYDLQAATPQVSAEANPRRAALTDFCHALLNASEFLYVE